VTGDARDQLDRADGLGEVVGAARGEAALLLAAGGVRGEGEDGDPDAGVAQRPRRLAAIHDGHLDIHEYQIDVLLAAAAVLGRAGDQERCLELVARAASLAAPSQFIQRFHDAERTVHDALRTLVAKPSAGAPAASPLFLAKLASTLGVPPDPAGRPNSIIDSLVEPLSKREQQVLDLLVAGRSYLEIGSALYVSRNTVKTHASHVYAKLGVSGRTAATERARELGLV